MRVHQQQPDVPSHAIARVLTALERFATPDIQFELDARAADLIVLHVIGRRDRVAADAEMFRRRGQQYAVVQYVLRSTQQPSPAAWVDLWEGARAVWSYYDLPALCAADGAPARFRFYHAPLGVDRAVFSPAPVPKSPTHLILSNSQGWLTESLRECALAAKRVGGRVLHLGPNTHREDVDNLPNLTDAEVAACYRRCAFVSGLRRTEGFELPVAEGLLCGARPLVFDRLEMRHWFDGLADFIPERPRDETVDEIAKVVQFPSTVPGQAALDQARERFDWATIVRGFWEATQG